MSQVEVVSLEQLTGLEDLRGLPFSRLGRAELHFVGLHLRREALKKNAY